jgi:hypothetical protein
VRILGSLLPQMSQLICVKDLELHLKPYQSAGMLPTSVYVSDLTPLQEERRKAWDESHRLAQAKAAASLARFEKEASSSSGGWGWTHTACCEGAPPLSLPADATNSVPDILRCMLLLISLLAHRQGDRGTCQGAGGAGGCSVSAQGGCQVIRGPRWVGGWLWLRQCGACECGGQDVIMSRWMCCDSPQSRYSKSPEKHKVSMFDPACALCGRAWGGSKEPVAACHMSLQGP